MRVVGSAANGVRFRSNTRNTLGVLLQHKYVLCRSKDKMKSFVLILLVAVLLFVAPLSSAQDDAERCSKYKDVIHKCQSEMEWEDCCHSISLALIDGCICEVQGHRQILLEACGYKVDTTEDCPAPGPAAEDIKIRSWIQHSRD